MIVVRNTFRLKFGQAKPALEVWKEGSALMKKLNYPEHRMLTDLTGPSYTFVLELNHESLSSYENDAKRILGTPEWRAWYEKFIPFCEEGAREIYTVVG